MRLSRNGVLVTLIDMSVNRKGARSSRTTAEMKIAVGSYWQMSDGRTLRVNAFEDGAVRMVAIPRHDGQQRITTMSKTYLVTNAVECRKIVVDGRLRFEPIA